ncbi:MAG TPA: O-antigen ligase family protein [Terriglobales bacterium]|nr:O-antigen ligase family protein [Terriglobales bacterium]
MNPHLATVVYVIGIAGLFVLDRDPRARTSRALWIPVFWLLINGSRPVSLWFHTGPLVVTSDQYLEGSPLDAAVYGILLVAGLAVLASRSNRVAVLLRTNLPILLFLSYCAISVFWSNYPFVAFKRWNKAVGDFVMVLIVVTDRDPLSAMKRLFTRVAFVLVPFSVLLIKYYPDLGRSYTPWTWQPMYSGVTTFKNLLGMTCLVCGLGSLWCFLTAYREPKTPQRRGHLIAHGALLVMVLWLFWITNSKTSSTCFLMATGVMILLSERWFRRRPVLVHGIVATLVGLSLCALFLDSAGFLVHSLGRDSTLTGRTEIWKAVLSVAQNPLLGSGFESFWLGKRLQAVEQLTLQNLQEAHNGYLEVYLNLGWMGVGLLALLIVTGYRSVLAVLRRDQQMGMIRMAFVVVGLTYSLTEAGFRMMCLVWIAFLLAIVEVPRSRPRKKATEPLPRSTEVSPAPAALPAQEEYV